MLFFIKSFNLDVVCILDSRANLQKAEAIAKKLHFDSIFCVPAIGQCGGIIVCWNPTYVNCTILNYHDRFVHCLIHDVLDNKDWMATFIYAYPQKEKQIDLWNLILNLKLPLQMPWALQGDFNNVWSPNEKVGRSYFNSNFHRANRSLTPLSMIVEQFLSLLRVFHSLGLMVTKMILLFLKGLIEF